ncbi:MAG TPA: hypothetical protein VI757_11005 [Bacteroidia bacterium]|nr:hypothetical protein [Bacteroidia bacterium]
MSDTEYKSSNEDINLYYYWKTIVKRKWLLSVVFFAIIVATLTITLLLPKTYRDEFLLHMATRDCFYISERISSNQDGVRLKGILPNTYHLVSDIKMIPSPDTVVFKMRILIDVKDTANINAVKAELFQYIINFPFYKKSVAQKQGQLQKEFNELSNAISYPEQILKSYNELLRNEKHVPVIFNPVVSYTGLEVLIKRKTVVEQMLKDNLGIEIITEEIYTNPVKPDLTGNLIKAFIASVLIMLFIVYFSAQFNK